MLYTITDCNTKIHSLTKSLLGNIMQCHVLLIWFKENKDGETFASLHIKNQIQGNKNDFVRKNDFVIKIDFNFVCCLFVLTISIMLKKSM